MSDVFDEWSKENVEPTPDTPKVPLKPGMQVKPPEGVVLKSLAHPFFQIGNVVRLRSGGPWMTVWERTERQGLWIYSVSWFIGEKLERDTFAEPELVASTTTRAAWAAMKAASSRKGKKDVERKR